MKKKTGHRLMAAVLMMSSGASAQLVSDDFETDVVGDQPANASVVRPTANGPDLFTKVVDSSVNTAGSGNGTHLYDNDVAAGLVLAYNFVADAPSQLSAVRVDVNFSCLDPSGPGDDYFYVSLGKYSTLLTLGGSAGRFTDARLYNDGTLDIRSGSGGSLTGTDVSTGSHALSIFVNDFSTSIAYTAPDSSVKVLPADSVAYWLNGSPLFVTSMDLDDPTSGGTVGTTENNLGKFGLGSGSTDTNLSYVVDDIVISSLEDNPPPFPDYLLSDTFDSDAVGGLPGTPGVVRPTTINPDFFVKVVDSSVNTAGSDNGAHLVDDSADSGGAAAMEYNFLDAASQVSAVRVDFDFSCLYTNGPGDDYFGISLGEYKIGWSFGSNSRRFTLARLYNDGTIDFSSASSTNSSIGNDVSSGSHTLTIFANDYDSQSVSYTGPDGSYQALPTNSVAYWLDGVLMITTLMDLDDPTVGTGGTVGTTEGNLAKFGFSSGTADTNLSYVVDNVLVTTNFLVDTYAEWVALYPGLGASNDQLDDPDMDGMENLLEYALGGNPTIDDASTILPESITDEVGGWLNYAYNRRLDDSSLTYEVKADSDLIGGLSDTAAEVGTLDLGNGFESVTNQISTATDPAGFMQLKVSQ